MLDELQSNCQKNYRILLDALSRPGRMVRLQAITGKNALGAAMAFGQCLLDHEVSLCVAGDDNASVLQAALVKKTQVRTEPLENADFVFVAGAESRGAAARAKRGSLASPEQGATLVYCLEDEPAPGHERLHIRLTGPGIEGPTGIMPEMAGVAPAEFELLGSVNADYPLGVEAFFIRSDGSLMALPRSTRIQVR